MYFATVFVALLSATSILAFPSEPQLQKRAAAVGVPPGYENPVWFGANILKPPSGKFTGISATIKVPNFKLGDQMLHEYAISAWIGLDGAAPGGKEALQLGINMYITEAGAKLTIPDGKDLVVRGLTGWTPDPFTEWTEPEFKIVFGDVLKLNLVATGEWSGTLSIENVSTGKKVSRDMTSPVGYKRLLGNTAEWIVESLYGSDGKLMGPPDFGTLTFSDCVATTSDGKTFGPGVGTVVNQAEKLKADISGNSVNIKFIPDSVLGVPPPKSPGGLRGSGKPGNKPKPGN